ncbi:MAG: hypothetical protein IJ222_07145 [Bacteroidales bacterium]|nr:hypothetical protein [Bacteroidales bacterium]
MSNTFNIKRFAKYLRYDLLSAWQNAGLSVIVIACMPVWLFAIYELYALVFGGGFSAISANAVVAAYVVSFMLATIFFPVQVYGKLTDRRPGSDWLLVPASRFEKFLSMLLVLCAALPLVWLAVIVCSDLLISFTPLYDGPAIGKAVGGMGAVFAEIHSDNVNLALNAPFAIYLSWCADILFFVLGAIFFRKNKIVHTFLTLMGIGILISLVAGFFASSGLFDIEVRGVNEDAFMRWFNVGVYALYVIEFALLDLGIYFRIKTLKH